MKTLVWVAMILGAIALLVILLKVSLWLFVHLLPILFGFAIGWAFGRAMRDPSP